MQQLHDFIGRYLVLVCLEAEVHRQVALWNN
jgi:hypothetical protein